MSPRNVEALLIAASLTLTTLGAAMAARSWIEATTPYGGPAVLASSVIDGSGINVQNVKACDTDTDCMNRYGGDGGPTPSN